MKIFKIALPSLVILSLVACGQNPATQELEKNDTNKATAKVQPTDNKKEALEQKKEEQKQEDIWTYYNDAKWSDDFKGLKSEIIKVVVSDKAPNQKDSKTYDASAVGIKFKMENTTDGIFSAFPDQARLVTSTGEQIDSPEMFLSDHIGGEIEKGVIKEGNIIWYLKRGHAEDIKWIKLKWNVRVGTEIGTDDRKTYDVEIKLK